MLERIKKHYTTLLDLLFIFCISFTPLLWFDPQKMVIGLDSGYPINFIEYFWQRTFTWLSSINFGTDMTTFMGLMPFHGIQALISALGVPLYSVEKVTFVIWFFVMSLSMYLLIHYLYPKKEFWILRLTTVIVYVFNLYIFSFWLNGEQTTFSVYALLPLLVLVLLKFLRNELTPLKAALYLNIIYFFLSAGGITGVPLLGSPIVAIILTVTVFMLIAAKQSFLHILKRLCLLVLCIIPFFIFLNAYWLIPFLANFRHEFAATVQGNGGLEGNLSWINYISKYTSYINLFRLQGDNNWYEHPNFFSNTYFTNPFLVMGSYILPILAYVSMLFVKDRKEKIIVILFTFFSLAGILFSAGSHNPFGFIYLFMMNHIPGFIAFRSAYYKFVIINYFAYSVLIGISLYYLLQFFKKSKIRYVAWVILIVLFLAYNYPFFQKSNFVFNAPFATMMKIPRYVLSFRDYEHKENNYRTLVVPSLNKDYPLNVYSWGYYGNSSLFPLISRNTFIYNNAGLSSSIEKSLVNDTYTYLANGQYDRFLQMTSVLNIHDVLLTEDIVANYGSSFTESPQIYKKAIESSHLFHIVWKEGLWTLYSLNQQPSGKIFASSNFDMYQGDMQNLPDIVSKENLPVVSQVSNAPMPLLKSKSNQTTQGIPCISCVLFANVVRPEIPVTYILPDSFIYQLKEWKEERSLKQSITPETKIPLLLQDSIKHVGELSELVQGHPQDIIVTQWQAETKPLADYMAQIEKSIPYFVATNNFPLLHQIGAYISTEKDTTVEMYNITHEKYNPDLQTAITDLLGREEKVLDKVRGAIDPYLEQRTYSFDISSVETFQRISIPIESLPVDMNQSPILPSKYTIDAKNFIPTVSMENGSLIIEDVPIDSHVLTINFDSITNLGSSATEAAVAFPDGMRDCLSVPLSNYAWRDIYNISVNNTLPVREGDVYVSAAYPKRTGILENDGSSYLHYVQSFHFISGKSSTSRTLFYGNQDYTSAIVYFCPKYPEEIKNLSHDISIAKLTQPVLYGINQNNQQTNTKNTVQLETKKINPTEYKVTVQNANAPYLLSFLESFSNEWKLYDANGKEVIAPHVTVDGYANGWYISKTGNYTLYIRFATQQLFITGVWVSLISIVLVLLITVYVVFPKKVKKI